MELTELPQELYTAIGSETRDFSVKAGSLKPFRKAVPGIIGGIAWMAFFSLIFFGIFNLDLSGMIAAGAAENKTINPAYYLLGFFGIFYTIGLIIIGKAIIPFIRRGGWFVGTPDRLVHYRRGNIRSIDWEQFTGDMKVRGNGAKGTISMSLRTGRIKRNKGGQTYIPDVIFMTGIPAVPEIEQLCRKRLKENSSLPDKDQTTQSGNQWKLTNYPRYSHL
ncbi:MAG: hypothetical protein ACM3UT_09060 [Chloroflexota bacterium]